MKLSINKFSGTAPRLSSRLLPPGAAGKAENCLLTSGEIRPYQESSLIVTPFYGDATKTFMRYEDSGTDYWFNWNTVVEVARGPVALDTKNRIFWTDGTKPKKTGNDIGIPAGGGGELPADYYYMGVVAPGGAPALAEPNAGSGETQVRAYVVTYVTGWGEESGPSAPTEITCKEGATIRVTKYVETPNAKHNISKWRIYRTNTGATGTYYQFVAEVASMGAAYYDETVASDDLGSELPQPSYDEPPDDMRGLITMDNGVMAGYSGKQVCFSAPYQPHAWPMEYRYAVDADIVALGAVGAVLIVATKGNPYIFSGVHPLAMSSRRMPHKQPCVNGQSLIEGEAGVVFATQDGLFLATSSGGAIITKPVFTKAEWSPLAPETIIAAHHDGKYYGSNLPAYGADRTFFIFDPAEPTNMMTTVRKNALALYSDLETDRLYMLLEDGSIYEWNTNSESRLPFIWKSGVMKTERPVNFGAIQVLAEFELIIGGVDVATYNATQTAKRAANAALLDDKNYAPMAVGVSAAGEYAPMSSEWMDSEYAASGLLIRLYANGELKDEINLLDDQPVRLSGGYKASEFEVEVEGYLAVREIHLAGSRAELLAV